MARMRYNPLFILWHIIKNDIHDLEYDPKTQWRFHLWMTRYWACNFPVVIILFFCFPKIWIAIALFINTIYSLYANLATDFGAVPSSYAAMKADELASGEKPEKLPPAFTQPFQNPSYRPLDPKLVHDIVKPDPTMQSKGLGWDEAESDAYLDMLAKEDENVATF